MSENEIFVRETTPNDRRPSQSHHRPGESPSIPDGSDDRGDCPTTRENCEFFLECVDESADLNKLGRIMVENLVKEIIQNHHQISLRLQESSFPAIKDPVIILGLPRTGSSYLFNLLGSTQVFRTLRHWETHKIASRKPAFMKKLEAVLMLKLMHHLSPGFRTVHEIRLEGPEECTKPLMNCFVSQSFPTLFHIPKYNRFLDTADYLPTYELYHQQLQILGDHGKRWLLKSPIHMQSIDSILKVFPTARFIHLHRDFDEVLCSICSLAAAYRCMTSHRLNGREIGSEVKKYLSRDLAKGQAVLDAHQEKVLNIHYKQIVDHPIQTVREIFEFVGCEFNEDSERSLEQEMQVSIPNKYGKHIYRFEDYYPSSDDTSPTESAEASERHNDSPSS
jgi:hypothetical protein